MSTIKRGKLGIDNFFILFGIFGSFMIPVYVFYKFKKIERPSSTVVSLLLRSLNAWMKTLPSSLKMSTITPFTTITPKQSKKLKLENTFSRKDRSCNVNSISDYAQ